MSAVPAYDYSAYPGSHLTVVHRKNETPLDVMDRLESNKQRLYVNVIGDASPEVKMDVSDQYKSAVVGNDEMMRKFGVSPVKQNREHTVYLFSEKPGRNSLKKAYTDFEDVFVNLYGVPKTPEYEYTRTKWLPTLRGKYADLMGGILGTPEDAEMDLNESLFHEDVHKRGHGMELYLNVIEEVTDYIMEINNITKDMGGVRNLIRDYCAQNYAVPIVEGITEDITRERAKGKSALQVHRDTMNPVITYERYMHNESGLIGKDYGMFSGYQMIGSARESRNFLRNYVRNSMNRRELLN